MVLYHPKNWPDRAPFEGVQLAIVNQSKAEILFQGLCLDDSWADDGNVPSLHKRTKPINESRCVSKKQYQLRHADMSDAGFYGKKYNERISHYMYVQPVP